MSLSSTDTSGIDDDDGYEDIVDELVLEEDDDDIDDEEDDENNQYYDTNEVLNTNNTTSNNNNNNNNNFTNNNSSTNNSNNSRGIINSHNSDRDQESNDEYFDSNEQEDEDQDDDYDDEFKDYDEEDQDENEEEEDEYYDISELIPAFFREVLNHYRNRRNNNNSRGNISNGSNNNNGGTNNNGSGSNSNSNSGSSGSNSNSNSNKEIPPLTTETIVSQIQSRSRDSNTRLEQFLFNRELTEKGVENIRISQHYLPQRKSTVVDTMDGRIFCCKMTNDGKRFMTASSDKKINIYDTSNWNRIKSIDAVDIHWSIIDTDYSPDQNWLIYSSWSQYIQLTRVDYNQSDEDYTRQSNNQSIRGGIRPSNDSYNESLYLDPTTERFCVYGLKFSPNNKEILCGCSEGIIKIYDLETRSILSSFDGHTFDVNSVSYLDYNGNIFVSGSDDCSIKVWDKRMLDSSGGDSIKPIGVFTGHSRGITHVTSKEDGIYLLSNSKDHSAKLWDIRKMGASNTKLYANYIDPRSGYLYFRNGEYFGESSSTTDYSLMTYKGHHVLQTLIRCYFSPLATTSQKYIYSGSYDGTVYIYDVLTGKKIQTLNYNSSPIRDLSWSPNSLNLVSTNWGGEVILYDVFDDVRKQNFNN